MLKKGNVRGNNTWAYLLGERIIADAGQGWAVSGSANLSKEK